MSCTIKITLPSIICTQLCFTNTLSPCHIFQRSGINSKFFRLYLYWNRAVCIVERNIVNFCLYTAIDIIRTTLPLQPSILPSKPHFFHDRTCVSRTVPVSHLGRNNEPCNCFVIQPKMYQSRRPYPAFDRTASTSASRMGFAPAYPSGSCVSRFT